METKRNLSVNKEVKILGIQQLGIEPDVIKPKPSVIQRLQKESARGKSKSAQRRNSRRLKLNAAPGTGQSILTDMFGSSP